MTDTQGRRPLKVRQSALSASAARWLAERDITPNQISIASVFFALLAALCIVALGSSSGIKVWIVAILAALFIQGRLLCNLFDGMVAVEGGKSTPAGELFNDIPDRIADPLILVAAGYTGGVMSGAAAWPASWLEPLGWLAALFALLTAYVRVLASSTGLPMQFQGPMAKQQRMALMTGACVLWPFFQLGGWQYHLMAVVLLIIVIGSAYTAMRRTRDAYTALSGRP